MQFSGDISAIFARISQAILPMNSTNISASDKNHKIKFPEREIVSGLGLLISGGLRPPKGFQSVHCPLVALVCSFLKFRHFGSGSALVRNLTESENCS